MSNKNDRKIALMNRIISNPNFTIADLKDSSMDAVGSTLTYSATVNPEVLGMTEEEVKSNPTLATERAAAYNLASMAIDSYDKDIANGVDYKQAFNKAKEQINTMTGAITSTDKVAKRNVISLLSSTDSEGNAYSKGLDGNEYFSNLTNGVDIGNSASQFLAKATGNTLLPQLVTRLFVENGWDKINYTNQSYKMAALMENYNHAVADDAMLNSFMKGTANVMSYVAPIFEGIGISAATGTSGLLALNVFKGAYNDYAFTTGSSEQMTADKFMSGIAFDTVTSAIGIGLGQAATEKLFGLEAMSANIFRKALTENSAREFAKYAFTPLLNVTANTVFDMATDYGLYTGANALGVEFIESTDQRYNLQRIMDVEKQSALEEGREANLAGAVTRSLLHNFGMRLATSIGSNYASVAMSKIRGVSNNRFMSTNWKDSNSAVFDGMRADNPSLFKFADIVSDWTFKAYPGSLANINEDLLRFNGNSKDLVSFLKDSNEFNAKAFSYLFVTQELATNALFRTLTGGVGSATSIGFMKGINYDTYRAFDAVLGRTNPANAGEFFRSTAMLADSDKLIIDTDSVDDIGKNLSTWISNGVDDTDRSNRYHIATNFLKNYAIAGEGYTSTDKIKLNNYLSTGVISKAKDVESIDLKEKSDVTYTEDVLKDVYDIVKTNARLYVGDKDSFSRVKSTIDTLNEIGKLAVDTKIFDGLAEVKNNESLFNFLLRQSGFSDNGDTTSIKTLVDEVSAIANQLMTDADIKADSADFIKQSQVTRLVRSAITTYIQYHAKQANFLSSQDNNNIKEEVRVGKIMEHMRKYVDGMILFGSRLSPIDRANVSRSMNTALSYVNKNKGLFLAPVQEYIGNKYGIDSRTVTDPIMIFTFADAVISNRLNAISVISKMKGTVRESFEDLTAYGLSKDYSTYRKLNAYSPVPVIYKDKFVTKINGEKVELVDGHFDQYLTTVIESLAEASDYTKVSDIANSKLFRELISVALRKYMDTLKGTDLLAVKGQENGGIANLFGIKVKTYDESSGLLEIEFSDKIKDNYSALAESLFKLRGEMSYRDLGPDKTNLYHESFVKELTDNTTYTLKKKVYNVSEGKDELNSVPGLRTHIRSLIAIHDDVDTIVKGALVYVKTNKADKYGIAVSSNNIVLKHMIRDEYHARSLENTLSVKIDSKNRVYFTNDKFFTNIGTVITSDDLTVVDIGFDSIKDANQANTARDVFTKAGFIQLVAGGSQGQKGLYVKLHTPYGADDNTKSETLLRALGNIAVNNITTVKQDIFTEAISYFQSKGTDYSRDDIAQRICDSLNLSTDVRDAFIEGLKGEFSFNMAVAISRRNSIKGTDYSDTIKKLKDEMINVASATYKAKAPTVSNADYSPVNQARVYIENDLKPDYTNKAYGGNLADLETKLTDAIADIDTRLATIQANDKDSVALGLTKQYFGEVLSSIKSPTDAITKEIATQMDSVFNTALTKFTLSDYNDVRTAISDSIRVNVGNEWETFKSTMRDNLLKDTDEMSSYVGIESIKARLSELANSATLNTESKTKAQEFLDKFDDDDFVEAFKNLRASKNLFDKVANATGTPKDVDTTAFKTWMDLDKAQDVQLGKLISTMALNGLPVMKPSYDLLKRVNASLVKSSITDGEIDSVINTITKNGNLELVLFDEGKNADLTVGAEEDDGTMFITNKLARVMLPLFGATDDSSKVTSRLFGGLVKINTVIEDGDSYRMRLSTENIKAVQAGTMSMLESLRQAGTDQDKIVIDTSDSKFTTDDKKAILYSIVKSMQLHQVIKQQPIETSYPTQNIINNFSRYMQNIDTNEIEANVNNKVNEINTKVANGEEVTPLEFTNTVKSSAREQSLPGYYHTVAYTTEESVRGRVAFGDSILVGSLNKPEFSIVGNSEGDRFPAKASISSYSLAKEIIGLSTNNKYKSLVSDDVVKHADTFIKAGDRRDNISGMGKASTTAITSMLDTLVAVGTFSKVDGNYYRIMNRSSNDGKLHFYPILVNEILSPTYKSAVFMNRKASRWELADYDGDTVVAMAIKNGGIMEMVDNGLRYLAPSEPVPDNETARLAKYTTLLDKQDEMSNLMLDFSYKVKNFIESNPDTAKMGGQDMALLFNVLEAANLSVLTRPTIQSESMSPEVKPQDLYSEGSLVGLDKDKSTVAVLKSLPFEFNFRAFDRFVVMTGDATSLYSNRVSSGFDVIDRQSIPNSSLGYVVSKFGDGSYQLMVYSNDTNKLGGTLVASVSADSMEAINQKIDLVKSAGDGLRITDNNVETEASKFLDKVRGGNFVIQTDSNIRIASVETIIKQFSDAFTNNPKTNFGKQLRQSLNNPAWSSQELGVSVMKILASASINTFSFTRSSVFVDTLVPYTLTPKSYNLSDSNQGDLGKSFMAKAANELGLVIPQDYTSISSASIKQAKTVFSERVVSIFEDIKDNLEFVKRVKKVFDGSSEPLSIAELKSLALELKKYNGNQTMLPYPMRVLSVLVNATTNANKEGSYSMMPSNQYVDNNLKTAFSKKFETQEIGNMYILSKEYVQFATNLSKITKALDLVKLTLSTVTNETLKFVSDGLNRTVSLNPNIKTQEELVNYITQFVKNKITVSSERGLGSNKETVENVLRTLGVYVSSNAETTVVRAPSFTEGQFYGVPNDTEEMGRMFTLVDSEGKGISVESLRNKMIERMSESSDVDANTTSKAIYTGLIYSLSGHSKTYTLLSTQGLTTKGIKEIREVLVDTNGELKFISDVDKIKDKTIYALMINQDNDLIVSSVLKSAKIDIVC